MGALLQFELGGPLIVNDTRYEDIVPDHRIVFAYSMALGDGRMSASLTTVEPEPAGRGTRLILTGQLVLPDGRGGTPANREQGWGGLPAALSREVERQG